MLVKQGWNKSKLSKDKSHKQIPVRCKEILHGNLNNTNDNFTEFYISKKPIGQ